MYAFRFVLAFVLLVQAAGAAPVVLGSTKIEIPPPQGYVEVTPQMNLIWQLVQAAQGEKHILAFYIPESQAKSALGGDPVTLDRNINVQTGRKFEGATLTREFFKQVQAQLKAMVASKQMDAIQAKELERLNGNIEEAVRINPRLAQLENATLPAHIDLPDQFAFSEISIEQATMPDGTISRGRVTATATALLVRGKLLNCYVTGGPDDLEWTRSTAKQWAEAIMAANR